ncbi:hypothetical protein AZL_011660 [Azospirillum sp. B510]|nr:hypothetical protein AZL_011660 [Azospirillum sp. B510]
MLGNQTHNLHNVNPGFGPGSHQLAIRVGAFAETVGAFNRNAWANSPKYAANRKKIEPWLSAVFQSEHLSLLLGSGFTSGIGYEAGATATGMGAVTFGCSHEEKLNAYATKKAANSGRGRPNIEDQLSAALTLAEGFRVAGMDAAAAEWETAIDRVLTGFMRSILQTERAVYQGLAAETEPAEGRAQGPPDPDLVPDELRKPSRVKGAPPHLYDELRPPCGIRLRSCRAAGHRPVRRRHQPHLPIIQTPSGPALQSPWNQGRATPAGRSRPLHQVARFHRLAAGRPDAPPRSAWVWRGCRQPSRGARGAFPFGHDLPQRGEGHRNGGIPLRRPFPRFFVCRKPPEFGPGDVWVWIW